MSRYVQLPLVHWSDDRRIECADATVLAAECVLMTVTKELESDGRLSRAQARSKLAGLAAFTNPEGTIDALIECGLAATIDERSILLVDWQQWMKPKAELDAYRDGQRESGRRAGVASGKSRRAKATNAERSGDGTPSIQDTEGSHEPNQPNPTERTQPTNRVVTRAAVIKAYVKWQNEEGNVDNGPGLARWLGGNHGRWIDTYLLSHPDARAEQVCQPLRDHIRQSPVLAP